MHHLRSTTCKVMEWYITLLSEADVSSTNCQRLLPHISDFILDVLSKASIQTFDSKWCLRDRGRRSFSDRHHFRAFLSLWDANSSFNSATSLSFLGSGSENFRHPLIDKRNPPVLRQFHWPATSLSFFGFWFRKFQTAWDR